MALTPTVLDLPPDGRFHHEDIELGRRLVFGPRTVTADEIIAFGKTYDPQPMHVDPIAAKSSPVGGLIASGYHTAALMMRMLCDGLILKSTSLGAPGVDSCEWVKPLKPGDTFFVTIEAHEKRVLKSRPDVGISKMTFLAVDPEGAPIMRLVSNQMMRLRRPDAGALKRTAAYPPSPKAPLSSLWDDCPGPVPPLPLSSFFFEDREIGEMQDLGSHAFDRDGIITFARAYDPQPFHLDEAAGRNSLFGGLAASGWQTAAVHLRHLILARARITDAALAAGFKIAATGPSPGFRDLKWPKPVLVGDTISFRSKIIEKRPLASRPDRGLLTSETQGRNQHGQLVFSVKGLVFVERRPAGGQQ